MTDPVYKMIEIVGTSQKGLDDAIAMAITKASKTLHNLNWFEVLQIRGNISNGKVDHTQVTLKVGFRLD